jgi:hypothetical protein
VIRYYELIGFAAITHLPHIVILGGGFQKRLGAGLWRRRMGKPKAWNFEPLFSAVAPLPLERDLPAGGSTRKVAQWLCCFDAMVLLLPFCFAVVCCCRATHPRVRYLGTSSVRAKTVVTRWESGARVKSLGVRIDQERLWRLGLDLLLGGK